MRRAVIHHLKANISVLGGVYQAFLAPGTVRKPYVTVKIPTCRGSPSISYAGTQPIEIRIYDDLSSFIGLDTIEGSIVDALHGREIADKHTGHMFEITWVPGGGDFVDEEKNLIGRLVMFEAALLFEPA